MLILVLALGGFLLYQENYSKPKEQDQVKNQEARIKQLEEKIAELEKSKAEAVANQSSNQPVANAPADTGAVAGASTESNASKSAQPISGRININTASATELDSLPGIGPVYAGRIIEYRTSHNGFKNIAEIQNVKGIGPKTFEKMQDKITVQ